LSLCGTCRDCGAALAHNYTRVLSDLLLNPDKAKEMGRKARQRVVDLFDSSRVPRALLDAFCQGTLRISLSIHLLHVSSECAIGKMNQAKRRPVVMTRAAALEIAAQGVEMLRLYELSIKNCLYDWDLV
jgi:hypothetical protein